ncbi:MAG: N-acetylglucosamine-6-phosphate deacetylase [Opitutaceae bacterium]|nr:N-acetylglucosamine-6-phosphate deacetylase [Opitutaceae bacterium]
MPPDGLFDFQVNGFAGVDFQTDGLSRTEFETAVAALRRHGTAGIFATFITDEVDALCRRLAAFEELCAASPAAATTILGYHLEGPWLCPTSGYRGAHPPGPMRAPSLTDFNRLQLAANRHIRLVTLAPEWPGASEFIAAVTATGVHVALGHTNATDRQVDDAIRAGARFCTHLGNGCPLELPRHDNIIQRLLARDELIACFIPDGIHLPPFVLRNLFRAKPAGRALFTTDAMAGAGAPPGRYTLGKLAIEVGHDGVARQPGGQGFAGSTLTPDEGVRRTAAYLGLTLEAAHTLWSTAAAEAFGVTLPRRERPSSVSTIPARIGPPD